MRCGAWDEGFEKNKAGRKEIGEEKRQRVRRERGSGRRSKGKKKQKWNGKSQKKGGRSAVRKARVLEGAESLDG